MNPLERLDSNISLSTNVSRRSCAHLGPHLTPHPLIGKENEQRINMFLPPRRRSRFEDTFDAEEPEEIYDGNAEDGTPGTPRAGKRARRRLRAGTVRS